MSRRKLGFGDKLPDSEVRRICFHEVGHYVIGGTWIDVAQVMIRVNEPPNNDVDDAAFNGRVRFEPGAVDISEPFHRIGGALSSMAGPFAEARLRKAARWWVLYANRADEQAACEGIKGLRSFDWLYNKTARLVARNWALISWTAEQFIQLARSEEVEPNGCVYIDRFQLRQIEESAPFEQYIEHPEHDTVKP